MGPHSPDAPRPYKRALCVPYQNQGSSVALLKLQMAEDNNADYYEVETCLAANKK
jgi:hypothetical protein